MSEKEKDDVLTDDDTFDEDESDSEGTEVVESKASPKKQSSKENARFKQMRLEQEQKEREKESYVKGKIDGIKTNTFTGQPIKTKADLEIYELQQKLEEEGKDPLNDLPAAIARARTEEEEKVAKELAEKNALNERVNRDIQEFYAEGGTKEELDEFLSEMKKPEWKEMLGDAIEQGVISPAKAYKVMKKVRGEAKKETPNKNKVVPPSPSGSQKAVKSVSELSQSEFDKLWNERYGSK